MKEKIKGVLLVGLFLGLIFLPFLSAEARSGCCSWHGGVCGCGCCDGTPLSSTCAPYYPGCSGGYSYPSTPSYDYSYPSIPSCPSMSSYDSLSGGCKCYSGYVVGKNFLGEEGCISASQKCHDDYGYNSSYNSLTNSCECSSGYAVSGGTCVSEDQLCRNQLGLFSSYNSLYDECKCSYGYVISGGSCTDGNSVCRSKHGIYSSYDDLDNSCECDSGYTLDASSQCIKKQNNAYFTLKELDADIKKAIIKSDYDYRYYLISYNTGCYSSSFNRYLNDQIVVNLGTDFDLDTWDKIVLQDDNETCDITRVENANSSTTLKPEEEEESSYYYASQPSPAVQAQPAENINVLPQTNKPNIAPEQPKPSVPSSQTKKFQIDETKITLLNSPIVETLITPGAFRECPSKECPVIRYYAETAEITILGDYNSGEWYKVNATNDDGNKISGWMHSSLFDQSVLSNQKGTATSSIAQTKSTNQGWWKKTLNWLFGWYK